MLNTAFPSDALDVALNDARRDDSAGVIESKQGTNKDTNYDCIVPQTVGGEVSPPLFSYARFFCAGMKEVMGI